MKKTVALLLGTGLCAVLLFSAIIATGCGGGSESKIDSAISKSADTKTFHTDYDLRVDSKGDPSQPSYSLGISGGADVDLRGSKPKTQGTVKFEGLDAILKGLSGSLSTDSSTGSEVDLIGGLLTNAQGIQFVLLEDKAYVNLGGLWYQTDASAASGLASGLAGGMGSAASSAGNVDMSCVLNALKDTNRFGATKIMTDIQELSGESINGVDTQHFKANLNLDQMLAEFSNAGRDCGGGAASGAVDAGRNQLGQMFKTKTIELWIDKENNINQIKIGLELDPAVAAGAASSIMGADTGGAASSTGTVTLSITMIRSDFNKDMNITKPEGNILKLSDLFSGAGLLGGALGGSSLGTGTSGSSGTVTVPDVSGLTVPSTAGSY